MKSKKALIFLPPISMTPTIELTMCHFYRLKKDYDVYTLGFGKKVIRSQFNLTASKLLHFYTLARQSQFNNLVQNRKMLILNKFLNDSPSNTNDKSKMFNDGVMSSLASRHRISDYSELTDYWKLQYHKLINDSQIIYDSTINIIKRFHIDLVGAFNGRFFDSSAFIKSAKTCNIDYFVYDVNRSKSQYYFYNVSLHDIKANQDKARNFFQVKNKYHLKVANDYFYRRRYGKRTYEKSYTSGQNIGLVPKFLKKEKKVIAIYPSSDDEYRFLSDSFKMKCLNQIEEIKKIAKILSKFSQDFQIIVRMHPNMATMPPSTLSKYYFLNKEYSIIDVVKPLEPFDTYAILDAAYAVFGFCSSILVESAYYKKNTVLVGPSPYLGLGLGDEFISGDEAGKFLVENRRFIIPNVQNALMWAAYINLHNDYLDGFSLDDSIPKVFGKIVPPLTFWRFLASISKLKVELFYDNKSSLNFKQKLRFFLRRFYLIFKSKWSS